MVISSFDTVENIVKKGENACYQDFLISHIVSQKVFFFKIIKSRNCVVQGKMRTWAKTLKNIFSQFCGRKIRMMKTPDLPKQLSVVYIHFIDNHSALHTNRICKAPADNMYRCKKCCREINFLPHNPDFNSQPITRQHNFRLVQIETVCRQQF